MKSSNFGNRLMKVTGKSLLLVMLITCIRGKVHGNDHTTPPNIIIVLTDDQGFGDFGINGNSLIETPVLNQLAYESVRFERFINVVAIRSTDFIRISLQIWFIFFMTDAVIFSGSSQFV